jgi:hypothetical protein
VLSHFVVSLIDGSVPGITGGDRSDGLDEGNALEQKHRHLAHHLGHIHRHGVIDDSILLLDLCHYLGANEDFHEDFLRLYALVRRPVLDVQSDNLEKLRQE